MLAKRIFQDGSKHLSFQSMRANVIVVKSRGVYKTAYHQPRSINPVAVDACLLQKFLD